MERTRQTLTPTPPELPSSETERETVRRLADEQQLWTGLSGETLTGTEVADHLTTAREWLNEHGWDPHDRRTVGIALIRTAPGGEGDKDASVAAGNLLGLLLQARANLNRWIDIEAWEAKHRRTWSEAAGLLRDAAQLARELGPKGGAR